MADKLTNHVGLMILAVALLASLAAAQEMPSTGTDNSITAAQERLLIGGTSLFAPLATAPTGATMPASWPASLPTTQPTTRSDPRPAWLIREETRLDRPAVIAYQMKFSPQEMAALSDINDNTMTLGNDHLLLMMLGHVGKLPRLKQVEFSVIEPTTARLLHEAPDTFRCAAVRLEVRVISARKLLAGKGLGFSPYWPKDTPVWELSCISPGILPQEQASDPRAHAVVVILSTVAPEEFLGEPDRTDGDGTMYYNKKARLVEMAGIFFKLFRAMSESEGMQSYPVVLAWDYRSGSRPPGSTNTGWMMPSMLLAAALVIGLFSWRYLRHRIARSKTYWQQQLDRVKGEGDAAGEEYCHEKVDPALLNAAEAYFKEHPEARPKAQPNTARAGAAAASQAASSSTQGDVDPQLRAASEQFLKEHPENDSNRPR